MIGIIVQLIISWLLLRFVERKNLSVFGFKLTSLRVKYFLLFFFLTAAISTSDYLLKMLIAKQRWVLSTNISFKNILEGVWWNIKSVIFEELIFRGALFYILLRRFGVSAAILVSGICFGIYHWFSHEVIGDPFAMFVTFITTGLMGAIYAYGFAKTSTLYTPIAIHLGWNIVRSVIFSDTVIGKQLFVEVKPAPVIQVGYLEYFILLFAALASVLLINYFLIRNLKQEKIL